MTDPNFGVFSATEPGSKSSNLREMETTVSSRMEKPVVEDDDILPRLSLGTVVRQSSLLLRLQVYKISDIVTSLNFVLDQ